MCMKPIRLIYQSFWGFFKKQKSDILPKFETKCGAKIQVTPDDLEPHLQQLPPFKLGQSYLLQ